MQDLTKICITNQLIAFEEGSMTKDETVQLFQTLIDSGLAWQLQGSYGRMADDLILAGICTGSNNPSHENVSSSAPVCID